MRRWGVWAAFGTVFVALVGSGYAPDLMLSREVEAARKAGILRDEKPPFIASKDDARTEYAAVFNRNGEAVRTLNANLARESSHPSPKVHTLLAEVEKASARPRFSVQWTKLRNEDGSVWTSAPVATVEANLGNAVVALTKSTPDASGLLTAARIANHLRDGDPVVAPNADWASAAGRVWDGANRLGLTGSERRRVIEALRPYPDMRETIRKHVSTAYAAVEKEPNSASLTRRKRAFLTFWSDFLRDLPNDPSVIAQRLHDKENEIRQVDSGIGLWERSYYPGTSRVSGWTAWADETAHTFERLKR